ncbi:MAG: sugar transferase [Deltaproteobacteria bacterium]|nr:MAG: sugar transferase [Deltaproteobacteria bacterium]
MARLGLLKAVVLALDLVAITLGLLLGHQVWAWYKPHIELVVPIRWWDLWLPNPFMPAGIAIAACWLLVLRQVGLYDPDRMTSSPRIVTGITRATAVVVVLVLVLQFLLPDRTYSRSLVLATTGITAVSMVVLRLAFFRINRHVPKPMALQRLVIVGVGRDAASMATRIERMDRPDLQLVGFLMPSEEHDEVAVPEDRILGGVPDLQRIVNDYDAQVFVLATRRITRDEGLQLATRADQMGLRVLQVPFTWGIASPRIDLASLGDLQLIDLTRLAYPTMGEQMKRLLDLTLVLTGGTLLLPFVAIVALIIKLQDGGPVFFVQERIGRGGRKFPFFKFRSMVVNAEELRDALQDANETDGVLFKMKDDPRITPFGHFIRKYSIDELPQLWNVVRGDMNLVGPRPLPMKDLVGADADPEVAYWMEMRQKVRPGITGPWQVSGRSDLGFEAMVNHDIAYVQQWSFWLDVLILVKTIPAVLKGRGAR